MADLFDIVVARKLSGGGGGGSSDFSTAQLTVVGGEGSFLFLPQVHDEEGLAGIENGGITESGTYVVPLYKGLLAGSIDTTGEVQTSGAVTVNDTMIIITGNGTITIS